MIDEVMENLLVKNLFFNCQKIIRKIVNNRSNTPKQLVSIKVNLLFRDDDLKIDDYADVSIIPFDVGVITHLLHNGDSLEDLLSWYIKYYCGSFGIDNHILVETKIGGKLNEF